VQEPGIVNIYQSTKIFFGCDSLKIALCKVLIVRGMQRRSERCLSSLSFVPFEPLERPLSRPQKPLFTISFDAIFRRVNIFSKNYKV
jgi:hypothetical protein